MIRDALPKRNIRMIPRTFYGEVNGMKHWVEKLMDGERRTSRIIMALAGGMFALFALLLCYMAVSPILDGVYTLDSAEKAERFSQRDYMDGVLPYSSARDMMASVVITTIRGDSLTSQIEGILSGSSQTDRTYNVYRLAGSGFSVIYLTEGQLEDTGIVHVQTANRELNDQILREASPNGSNIYLLYDADSPAPYFTLTGFLILLAAGLFWLNGSSLLRKRTSLGRRIAKEGDFRELSRKINLQAEHPIFDASGVTVLKDWAILKKYAAYVKDPVWTTILPASDVEGVEVAPEADEDGEHACSIAIKGWAHPYVIGLDERQAVLLKSAVGEMNGRDRL